MSTEGRQDRNSGSNCTRSKRKRKRELKKVYDERRQVHMDGEEGGSEGGEAGRRGGRGEERSSCRGRSNGNGSSKRKRKRVRRQHGRDRRQLTQMVRKEGAGRSEGEG